MVEVYMNIRSTKFGKIFPKLLAITTFHPVGFVHFLMIAEMGQMIFEVWGIKDSH